MTIWIQAIIIIQPFNSLSRWLEILFWDFYELILTKVELFYDLPRVFRKNSRWLAHYWNTNEIVSVSKIAGSPPFLVQSRNYLGLMVMDPSNTICYSHNGLSVPRRQRDKCLSDLTCLSYHSLFVVQSEKYLRLMVRMLSILPVCYGRKGLSVLPMATKQHSVAPWLELPFPCT